MRYTNANLSTAPQPPLLLLNLHAGHLGLLRAPLRIPSPHTHCSSLPRAISGAGLEVLAYATAMTKHPFRVIEGGAAVASELPTHLPPELARQLTEWFFAETADHSAVNAGRLLQRRIELLCALTQSLSQVIEAGLDAAQACDQGYRDAAFKQALQVAHQKRMQDLAEKEV